MFDAAIERLQAACVAADVDAALNAALDVIAIMSGLPMISDRLREILDDARDTRPGKSDAQMRSELKVVRAQQALREAHASSDPRAIEDAQLRLADAQADLAHSSR
jgi:hypothetical protein